MMPMSVTKSPAPFEGDYDDFYDANFTAEISTKMQVPKRIKVSGTNAEDDDDTVSVIQRPDKIDMRVPDRILVAGQDQHIGTHAPRPLELEIENTIMPPDPGMVRVLTPPRVITLDEHHFPTAAEDFYIEGNKMMATASAAVEQGIRMINTTPLNNMNHIRNNSIVNQSDFVMDTSTDMYANSTAEEVAHLRKQLAKLNRRVMNVEREMITRQQRDKLFFTVASAYLVIKILVWMNRST